LVVLDTIGIEYGFEFGWSVIIDVTDLGEDGVFGWIPGSTLGGGREAGGRSEEHLIVRVIVRVIVRPCDGKRICDGERAGDTRERARGASDGERARGA